MRATLRASVILPVPCSMATTRVEPPGGGGRRRWSWHRKRGGRRGLCDAACPVLHVDDQQGGILGRGPGRWDWQRMLDDGKGGDSGGR
jgi:hypothetical protein